MAKKRKSSSATMSLFYYFFKTLVGKEVVVELKNDLAIRGTLHSVDQVRNKNCERKRWSGVGGGGGGTA